MLRELSPRIIIKVAWLYAFKGWLAIRAYKKRLQRKELYPPFMFIALTNKCNLRCQGCWVEKEGPANHLGEDELDIIIENGKKQSAYYYTLLGGEPMIYPNLWDILSKHSDCYFQIITNGMFFNDQNTKRLKTLGNVTPLISLDGLRENNDLRRGAGVFDAAIKGMESLKRQGLFFGVAVTSTSKNLNEVMSDSFLKLLINSGAMYVWYYVYRPVGDDPHPEYALNREQLIDFRRKLIEIRKVHPILIIDTYWTAEGEAFCPAATGMGFHIGPQGSIEICPPLSFATNLVTDNDKDLYETINSSRYLRGFQKFVKDRTKGCVILEHPKELTDFIKENDAKDYSGRNALNEISGIVPKNSHHLPEDEIAEEQFLYRFLKKQVFFGMGAAG